MQLTVTPALLYAALQAPLSSKRMLESESVITISKLESVSFTNKGQRYYNNNN